MAIEIKISGEADPALRKSLRSATTFFIKELMPRKRKLKIRIVCKNGLLNLYGECHHVSTKDHSFKIYIDVAYDINTILSTLAHECVHVRQFCQRELNMTESYARWKGEIYCYADRSEEPWEDDACALEVILLDKYKDG